MNGIVVTLATIALIVASAFFVIIEFSLLAARRNRLEQEAGESRSARAALRSLNELTVMLAGAQLGITVCTFALGAVTKPAVDHALGPQLQEWGIPAAIAGTVSFIFSLVFVTFLHLVVGEMAPKSWAIAHPERSAKLVSMPARGFIMLVKPLLQFVNVMANKLVKATGVEPVDRAAVGGRDIDTIRALVEQSANAGALAPEFETQISGVAELQRMTVAEIAGAARPQATVSEGATAGEVRAVSQNTGYKRILVAGAAGDVDGSGRVGAADVTGASDAASGGNQVASFSGGNRTPAAPMGIVHVRDVLLADAEEQIGSHVREVMTITESTPVYEAFARMRERSEHIAVVIDENGAYSGVLSIKSILTKLLPVVEKRIPEESEQRRSPAVDREN
ncbi:hemolysin family protein [Corynebacterium urogenitale]